MAQTHEPLPPVFDDEEEDPELTAQLDQEAELEENYGLDEDDVSPPVKGPGFAHERQTLEQTNFRQGRAAKKSASPLVDKTKRHRTR